MIPVVAGDPEGWLGGVVWVVAGTPLAGGGKLQTVIDTCRRADPGERQDIHWVVQRLEESL